MMLASSDLEANAEFFNEEAASLIQEKIQNLRSENKVLQQKLDSKTEALLILSKDLDKVRTECDDYKNLTDSLQRKCSDLKRWQHSSISPNWQSVQENVLTKNLSELKSENKKLMVERESLKTLLKDREEDVKAIRKQLLQDSAKLKLAENVDGLREGEKNGISSDDLVQKLETLQHKYNCLRQDLQGLLDEKEDLVQERDSYKHKVHRLNHALNALLKSEGYKIIDLDWILAENLFLKESLDQMRDEKLLANQMGKRYKSALEKSHKFSSATSTASSSSSSSKESQSKTEAEVLKLIKDTSFPCPLKFDIKSQESLVEICNSLLETLNDRMTQLKHQRKANKYIASKLRQVEAKVQDMGPQGDLILNPTAALMRGYSKSDVDNNPEPEDSTSGQEVSSSHSSSPAPNAEKHSNLDVNPHQGDLSNPPDIIAQGFRRQNVEETTLDSHQEEENDNELLIPQTEIDEDAIVLPDHLKNLVDAAMKSLEEQVL